MTTTNELKELKELYKNNFTPDYEENPYLVDFNKRISELDKKTVKEFAKILSLYKSRFIEQSMQIFPMTTDDLNYRNGVVIEISKLINTIEQYSIEKPGNPCEVYEDKNQNSQNIYSCHNRYKYVSYL